MTDNIMSDIVTAMCGFPEFKVLQCLHHACSTPYYQGVNPFARALLTNVTEALNICAATWTVSPVTLVLKNLQAITALSNEQPWLLTLP